MAASWLINAFGVAGGCCSLTSFVPQIVKILREREAEGVSLRMYGVTVVGFCCWTTYGLLSGAWPVAASNSVCALLAAWIFALRLRFGDAKPAKS